MSANASNPSLGIFVSVQISLDLQVISYQVTFARIETVPRLDRIRSPGIHISRLRRKNGAEALRDGVDATIQ